MAWLGRGHPWEGRAHGPVPSHPHSLVVSDMTRMRVLNRSLSFLCLSISQNTPAQSLTHSLQSGSRVDTASSEQKPTKAYPRDLPRLSSSTRTRLEPNFAQYASAFTDIRESESERGKRKKMREIVEREKARERVKERKRERKRERERERGERRRDRGKRRTQRSRSRLQMQSAYDNQSAMQPKPATLLRLCVICGYR